MRKETKLTRIPQREKFTDWKFELPHKNIILDSIKAYGCKKDEIKLKYLSKYIYVLIIR